MIKTIQLCNQSTSSGQEPVAESEMPDVLAIIPGIIPSTSILIIKPLLQLSRAGLIKLQIVLESSVKQKQVAQADLIMFCRNTEPRYSSTLDLTRQMGIPYIYDLDDNFFELSENTELGAYHRQPDRIALLKEYISGAALVRVYSRTMLDYIRPINPKVIRAFAPIDFGRIDRAVKEFEDTVKLVFSTSSYQNDLLSIVLPAIDSILRKYKGRVEAHFWGVKPTGLKGENWYFHRFIMDYDRFLRKFSRAHYDIGLAPMRNDLFHNSKTNNKFREYGACGIAGIYSDMEVYSANVRHGSTGLLVANRTECWHEAIVQLIENSELRRDMASMAREYVLHHYSQDLFEHVTLDLIRQTVLLKSGRDEKHIYRTLNIAAHPRLGNFAKIARKFRNWRNRMKILEKNPISFFLWMAARSLYVRWYFFNYRIATSSAFQRLRRRKMKSRGPGHIRINSIGTHISTLGAQASRRPSNSTADNFHNTSR
jgi:glycosyltransferase involved in cell wall biosynthesis